MLTVIIISCKSNENHAIVNYPNSVGDIEFDESLDELDFKLCRDYENSIQYYQIRNIEEMLAVIKRRIVELYSVSDNMKGQTGFITFRFIVNCQGELGRFRIQTINDDFKESVFDESIPNQLLKIIKGIDEWKNFSQYNIDYYQYLTFRIKDGKIETITP